MTTLGGGYCPSWLFDGNKLSDLPKVAQLGYSWARKGGDTTILAECDVLIQLGVTAAVLSQVWQMVRMPRHERGILHGWV